MNRDQVLERLKAVEPVIRENGVAGLYLYGSYARNDAHALSDIDVFIDPIDPQSFDVMATVETLAILEKAFPDTLIGYGTRDNLATSYRKQIEETAVRVF